MPIDFSRIIAANVTAFGSAVIFRDPLGVITDTALSGIWSERDVAEPTRGVFSTLTVVTAALPVANPLRREDHYRILDGSVEYRIIDAVWDEGGATRLKLKKVTP